MKKLIQSLRLWWNRHRYFVILDASDNSVTLSSALFRHMKQHLPPLPEGAETAQPAEAQVFVFFIPEERTYGFTTYLPEEPTQLCTIQYNTKYRCVGFESLCPSVVKMYYDYMLTLSRRYKVYVDIAQSADDKIYYKLIRS